MAIIMVLGVCGVGRSTIGYLYLMELIPKRNKRFVGTINMAANAAVYVMSAFFFWLISKDTKNF
jgi:hypothetical protein